MTHYEFATFRSAIIEDERRRVDKPSEQRAPGRENTEDLTPDRADIGDEAVGTGMYHQLETLIGKDPEVPHIALDRFDREALAFRY